MVRAPRASRRETWAWYLYDFGNSAYAAVVLLAVYAAYSKGTAVRIGEPFGPLRASGKGQSRRDELDTIGHEIMRRIAALIPPERRGLYSDDPEIRAAASWTEEFPWDDLDG